MGRLHLNRWKKFGPSKSFIHGPVIHIKNLVVLTVQNSGMKGQIMGRKLSLLTDVDRATNTTCFSNNVFLAPAETAPEKNRFGFPSM